MRVTRAFQVERLNKQRYVGMKTHYMQAIMRRARWLKYMVPEEGWGDKLGSNCE